MTIKRKTSETIEVVFSDDNQPIDLTGYTLFFTVKRRLTDTDVVMSYETSSHTDPEQGESQIVLTQEDTDIPVGNYYWDLILIKNNIRFGTEYGTLEITPSVKD